MTATLIETTHYVNPTSDQQWLWEHAGLCVFCGGKPEGNRCVCRRCDSCSSTWIADTKAEYNEGRPLIEECSDCLATPRCPCGAYLDEIDEETGRCVSCRNEDARIERKREVELYGEVEAGIVGG